ncbi:hypothetical protein [Scandinavium sp.]|uniref:hypothetical protein n=1 Tax=Scandinavium sp. TaxID=2830653 RepID=UPI002897B274|nr:hypothetical protein [Scandinavium sp.]
MGRTLEQILVEEDPLMIAEARKLAAEMLLDIEKAEHARHKEGTTVEAPLRQNHISRR